MFGFFSSCSVAWAALGRVCVYSLQAGNMVSLDHLDQNQLVFVARCSLGLHGPPEWADPTFHAPLLRLDVAVREPPMEARPLSER